MVVQESVITVVKIAEICLQIARDTPSQQLVILEIKVTLIVLTVLNHLKSM